MKNENSNLNDNVMLFFRVLMGFNLLLALYLLGKLVFPDIEFFHTNIFFYRDNMFMDFFNDLYWSRNRDPYSYEWGNFPPLFFVISFVLANILKTLTGLDDFYEIRNTYSGRIVYLLFAGFCVFIICRTMKKILRTSNRTTLVFSCLIIVTSYPFLWAFDRGNFVVLTAALIAAFIVCYNNGKYVSAAFILGIAAALKMYPAILGTVFLADKKYREAIICACTGLLSTLLSFAFFEGGIIFNISVFLTKAAQYVNWGNATSVQNMSYNNSLYMLLDIPYVYFTNNFDIERSDLAQVNIPVKIISFILLVIIILICFLMKNNHDRILILCCSMILYPFNSSDYNLTILLVPIVFWLVNEKSDLYFIAIVGGLLLSSKHYQSFYNQGDYCSLTIQSFLNPILLCMIAGYIIFIRKEEIFYGFRTITHKRMSKK